MTVSIHGVQGALARARLMRLREALGAAGLAALALFALSLAFMVFALQPLEAQDQALGVRLEQGERLHAPQAGDAQAATPMVRLGAFYRHLTTREETTDFLAKLHALSLKAGTELRSADYRVKKAAGPIERHEIALVATGTYAQVRAFLANSLIQVPVLSLDQVKFKRQHANDSRVQAELNLTLHVVKP